MPLQPVQLRNILAKDDEPARRSPFQRGRTHGLPVLGAETTESFRCPGAKTKARNATASNSKAKAPKDDLRIS
jgi:hypothetical protein